MTKLSITPPSRKAAPAPANKAAAREAKAIEEGTERITLDLPISLHRNLKMSAAATGKSMRKLIIEALNAAGLR